MDKSVTRKKNGPYLIPNLQFFDKVAQCILNQMCVFMVQDNGTLFIVTIVKHPE